MANRVFPDGVGQSGADVLAQLAALGASLFNTILLRPTAITNSGNDYTITIDPVLNVSTDVVTPMGFYLKPNADNTGDVRIRVTASNPYHSCLKANGEQFAANQFRVDTFYFIVFLDGNFIALSDSNLTNASDVPLNYVLTSSGTLDLTDIKAIKSPNTPVRVEVWGGGGGGRNTTPGGGGGGGAYDEIWLSLGDLDDLTAYTIGNGGAVQTNGSASSFGTFVTTDFGRGTTTGFGGAGGVGMFNGGAGGEGTSGNENGGNSIKGGGGGAADSGTPGTAGVSRFGGNGGADGVAGSSPGGGGGQNAAGARGEIRVRIF